LQQEADEAEHRADNRIKPRIWMALCPPKLGQQHTWRIMALFRAPRGPLLSGGGVAARSRKVAKPHQPRRRGGAGQKIPWPTPPRPLHQRMLRDIFLVVASTPPPLRRGRSTP